MFSTFMDMLILKTEMYKIFKQMSKWNEFKEWCFCINKNEFTSEKMQFGLMFPKCNIFNKKGIYFQNEQSLMPHELSLINFFIHL